MQEESSADTSISIRMCNQGLGRGDFRFFTEGNLLAILFGLATSEASREIMSLFDNCTRVDLDAMYCPDIV